MTYYTIYLHHDVDGETVDEIATAETKLEALRLIEKELKCENTISAYAVDANGDLLETDLWADGIANSGTSFNTPPSA